MYNTIVLLHVSEYNIDKSKLTVETLIKIDLILFVMVLLSSNPSPRMHTHKLANYQSLMCPKRPRFIIFCTVNKIIIYKMNKIV